MAYIVAILLFTFLMTSACGGTAVSPGSAWTDVPGTDGYMQYIEFTNDAGEHCTVIDDDSNDSNGLSCTAAPGSR